MDHDGGAHLPQPASSSGTPPAAEPPPDAGTSPAAEPPPAAVPPPAAADPPDLPQPPAAQLSRLGAPLAGGHHLLLVSAEVDWEEVETLVTSLVHGSSWTQPPHDGLPGTLDLLAAEPDADVHARLTGPWQVDLLLRHALDLPSWVAAAWIVDVPVERSGPVPPGRYGALLDAFGPEHPHGVERQVLDVALACARRLAGAVRTTTGVLLEPDPASAVDLTIYSPLWLEPAALHHVLTPALPGLEVLAGVSPEAAADLDGYGAAVTLSDPGAHGELLTIEVEGVEMLPAALAALEWTRSGVVSYRIHWVQQEQAGDAAGETDAAERGARRTREAVLRRVEETAAVLHEAVGGEILDEDSFLVDPGQLRRLDPRDPD